MSSKNSDDVDPEKNATKPESTPEWDVGEAPKAPWTRRFVDSFKRDPNAHVSKPGQDIESSGGHGSGNTAGQYAAGHYDHKAAAEATANSGLAHKLKSRHMQMIAIGGSIGKLERTSGTRGALLTASRNWSLGHVWLCSCHRRAGISCNRLYPHRNSHVLHHASSGRAGGHLPCCRVFLGLLDPFSGSGMGFCHGLEVSSAARWKLSRG